MRQKWNGKEQTEQNGTEEYKVKGRMGGTDRSGKCRNGRTGETEGEGRSDGDKWVFENAVLLP
jgi:hypothetical protein